MLTTGLLRVELAPEEYQLYSEGCRFRGEVRGWQDGSTREDRCETTWHNNGGQL